MISRIQTARFSTTKWRSSCAGYDMRPVDEFLDLLVQVLIGVGSLDPRMVRDTRFPVTRWRRGYAQPDVDALLAEVERYASGYR
jgi:DivIVA domain-containing protein